MILLRKRRERPANVVEAFNSVHFSPSSQISIPIHHEFSMWIHWLITSSCCTDRHRDDETQAPYCHVKKRWEFPDTGRGDSEKYRIYPTGKDTTTIPFRELVEWGYCRWAGLTLHGIHCCSFSIHPSSVWDLRYCIPFQQAIIFLHSNRSSTARRTVLDKLPRNTILRTTEIQHHGP